jgi:Chaperone of endosialidase
LNADADENTATRSLALSSDTSGAANTATGFQSLFSNISGYTNTAAGVNVLYSNRSGYYNTASGVSALFFNVGGHDNVAEGYKTLLHNTGSNNVSLGSNAGGNLTTGSNNVDIGANVLGTAGDANTIRIGKSGTQTKTFIAGISGKTVASGVGVIINSNGQLGTLQSSTRFKEAIKWMDQTSEGILALKPVTFRYKKELDPEGIPQFGLVAEEVEKVNPDLVARDPEGNVYTVRYEAECDAAE